MNEQLIQRVATALGVGADIESIHNFLIEAGLTEYQAWLTYEAGKISFDDRRIT